MNKRFDVIVVGELNVDLILDRIDQFPQPGKEVLADQMVLTLGSSAAIFASNIRTLGVSVSFVGKLGKDQFGDFILQRLEEKGVHTGNILAAPGHFTGATIILNVDTDRAMVTSPGAMNDLSINDIRKEVLALGRHLHVSSVFLQQGLRKDIVALLKTAKKLGLSTSVDPQWDPLEKWDLDLKSVLEYTDVFLPNMAEIKALARAEKSSDALEFVKGFNAIIVVKDSVNGAYAWNGKELLHQPAYLNNSPVDSIGAGDSFDAGFMDGYLKNRPLEECLRLGALMGAVNTTAPGGTAAFDSMESVKKVAFKAFNYSF